MGELGILGLPVPERYGGLGLDYVSLALACDELEYVDTFLRVIMSVHVGLNSLALLQWGTEEQKQRWLVPQAQGTKIATFGLTEPNAGSDAGSIESTVVRDGDHYILNGAKMWISLADVADHFLVFASIDRSKKHHGLCAFMLERGMEGFTTGTIKGKLGVRAGNTGELAFNNVRVPVENRIGEEGEGFKIAMSCIDQGRFTVGAGAVGLTRAALDASVKYANEREAFGEPIGSFQLVKQMIARMVAGYEASYLLTMQAAELKNQGARNTRETSLMKWYACDVALQSADDAIQIHGSYGFSNEYPVERMWRNARGAVIYEGTREVHTLLQADYALGYRKDKPLSHPQPPAQGFETEELLAMTR
jgi:glutaryl-CoA dehydrogenase (non-decarboxylating)